MRVTIYKKIMCPLKETPPKKITTVFKLIKMVHTNSDDIHRD